MYLDFFDRKILDVLDSARATLTNNGYGIVFYPSSDNNSISANTITNSTYYGIELLSSSNNNSISANIITNSDCGIYLSSSSGNSISANIITSNNNGIVFHTTSDNNSISANTITNNNDGIYLSTSTGNSISSNTITNNGNGTELSLSSNNFVCHNNFVGNTAAQARASPGYGNTWDDGYPSGGNYWSNYTGIDTNHDGIGDTAYVIDTNNTDNHPLMGMFNNYNVTYYTPPIVPHACNVTVISNSTISDFVAPIWIEHPEVIFLQFNVSGAEGSNGFCRVSFPTAMMNSTYHVSVNGTEIPYTLLPFSDAIYSYLYFTYTHSTETVIIIPEFPSLLILLLFFITTLLAFMVYTRQHGYSTGK